MRAAFASRPRAKYSLQRPERAAGAQGRAPALVG